MRPDKANTWIELDFTNIYQANMRGKEPIFEIPYIPYIEKPVQLCWHYYKYEGRNVFRYAVFREADLRVAINFNLFVLYRNV